MNHNLTITVTGRTGSGKTLIQQYIADALWARGIHADIDWGIDGDPNRSPENAAAILDTVGPLMHITINTRQLNRSHHDFQY